MFSLRDVTVTAGGAVLLDGLTADFGPGVNVITGPSGAGKTTLLRVLVRLLDPVSGQIVYQGRPLPALPVPELRRQLQLVGQRATLLTTRVRDEVRAAKPDLTDAQVGRLLTDVGLDHGPFTDRHTTGLSAGQAQRLCLARSLALRPRALLLDEPTAHLDESATAVVERAITDFAAAGGTVLLVSHDAAQVTRFGGPVLTLKNGRAAP